MSMLTIAFFVLAAQVAPQGPGGISVQAVVAPDSVRIGQLLTLTVTVSGVADNAEVSFPELPDTGTVAALGPPQVLGDMEPGVRGARYRLAAWNTGQLALPEAEVRIVAGVTELAVPFPDVTVRVAPLIPADADLDTLPWQPAADVVGGNWSMAERLAATGLLLAVLIGAVVLVRRSGVASPVPVPSGTPPRDRALAALDRLQEAGLAEAGEFKGYYSALSQIVRDFLADTESRWGLDLTTPELVAAVGGAKVDPSEVLSLGQLLIGADLVKFARQRPTPDEAARSLGTARGWIEAFEPPRAKPVELAEPATPFREGEPEQDEWDTALTVLEELFTDDEFTVDSRIFTENGAGEEYGNEDERSGS